jgi:peptidoglycan/xylan/chitin deacetylase (PgdA/CDA1 family)
MTAPETGSKPSTQSPRYTYSPIIEREPRPLPDAARIAVLVYVNVEHFPYDSPELADHVITPVTQRFTPDVLNGSWRDYGLRVGLWRLIEVLEACAIPPTIMLHSDVCHEYPQIIRYGVERGWEWVGHGVSSDSVSPDMSEAEERTMIVDVIETIERATGCRPRGWFSAKISQSPRTPDLLAAMGIEYLCDYSADDQPFPVHVGAGSLVSVPYNVQLVDVVPLHVKGVPPREYADMLIDQFDILYAEGQTRPRIMPISLHPFVAGQAYRIKHLWRALEHIAVHPGVWLAQAGEVNDWYRGRELT